MCEQIYGAVCVTLLIVNQCRLSYNFSDKILSCLSQRKQNRRNYNYDTEDIIEGKRTFSVEEKLASPKFAEGDFVKNCSGDGGSKQELFCSIKIAFMMLFAY